MNTAKYYIPGETKEIEALRRKGILNGSILISDIIVELCNNKQIVGRIKQELIDNFDANDFKIHFYAIFMGYRRKLSSLLDKTTVEEGEDIEKFNKIMDEGKNEMDSLSTIENDKVFI